MGSIPPFILQILGVVVRVAVVWFADKIGVALSDDQILQVTTQVSLVLGVIAWSLYQKYRGRLKLLTACVSSKVLSERQVEAIVDNPNYPNPSVLTPKHEVPL